jgi:hypothetical protein
MQLAKFDVVPQHIQNQIAAKNQTVAAWWSTLVPCKQFFLQVMH